MVHDFSLNQIIIFLDKTAVCVCVCLQADTDEEEEEEEEVGGGAGGGGEGSSSLPPPCTCPYFGKGQRSPSAGAASGVVIVGETLLGKLGRALAVDTEGPQSAASSREATPRAQPRGMSPPQQPLEYQAGDTRNMSIAQQPASQHQLIGS